MTTRFRLLLIILALLPLACGLPAAVGMNSGGTTGVPILAVAPPGSTSTPTPFMPLPPTPTYLPTDFPTPLPSPTPEPDREPELSYTTPPNRTWADYPGPTVWPDIAVPAPMGIFSQPVGQVNILLLGSDQRPNDGGFRTDTILLLTLNPQQGTVHLTSFPRDLYVYIPGWTVQRINTAFVRGGFDLMSLTMEYNFGVVPDYYVMINFNAFSDVIDSLGGINVNVGRTLTDHRDGHGSYSVYTGMNHMDGEEALWYVRSRYSTSDFDRGRRQQEVVQAIFNRMLSLNALARAPEIYNSYVRNVTTNMDLDDITPLLALAAQVSESAEIEHFYIGPQQVTSWVNSNGAQVLLPIRENVRSVMQQALNVPPE